MPGMFGKVNDKEILDRIFGNPGAAAEVFKGFPAPRRHIIREEVIEYIPEEEEYEVEEEE